MSKAAQWILALLSAMGIVLAVGKAFVWGDSVVNYGSYVPWGLWVSLYIFLVGAAAGATWFSLYLGLQARTVQWIKIGFVSAALCLIGALAFIALDLGKPVKGITIFFSPSFSSPLAWASWGYALFIVAVVILFLMKTSSYKSPLVYVAAALSLVFIVAEASFFSGMIARPLWNSWTNALAFLTSALAAGGALVYGIAHLLAPALLEKQAAKLRKGLFYAVILHLIVALGHVLLELEGAEAKVQLSDWKFWLIFVVIGSLLALYLLRKPAQAVWGSVLVLVGMVYYKYSLVSAAFAEPAMKGLPESFQHTRLSLSYVPSAVEWLAAVGLLSLVLLVITLVIPKLTVEPIASNNDSAMKA